MALRAYEGKENFAFISYAHKDSERVLRILHRMAREGYRVWYDEGIAPGSEWPENIAQHLNDCAVAVAFVSNNSIASANCRREVTFALAKHKPFLGILLEPTEMSLGMEMQLSAQQCILRHNYTDEEEFIQKILSSPDLQPCRDVIAVLREDEEIESARIAEEQFSSVQQSRPKAAAPAKEKKSKPAKPAREKKALPADDGKKKKLPPGVIIAAAAAALVLALVLILSLGGKEELPDGTKVDKGAEYVSLQETTFNKAAANVLKEMENLNSLTLSDCTVEDGALDFLPQSGIKHLSLSGCTGISDFSFLSETTALQTLKVVNCGLNNNIDLTGHIELYNVDLSRNPTFTDLSVLPLSNVSNLCFSETGVADVSALSEAVQLAAVQANGCPVTSIDALAGLTTLEELYFNDCQIAQISQPFMSLSLQEVGLRNNGLDNLEQMANLTVLTSADLAGNDLTRVDWLSKSAATLTRLDLQGNRLAFDDLHFLPAMTALKELYLQDMVTLRNLDDIAPLTNLEVLVIRDTYLETLEGIGALTKLRKLDLHNNHISDLTPLSGMAFPELMELDLAENRIEDISPLPRGSYRLLALHGNREVFHPEDLKGLEGYYLTLDYDETLDSCTDAQGFSWPFVVNCPADKQLALKDVLNHGVIFATDDTIASLLTSEGYPYT